MINGTVQLELFAYQIVDGETKLPDGSSKACKMLVIKDRHSGLFVNLYFALEDWNKFIQNIQGNKILPVTVLPSKIGLMPN
jgi:hypothetical protein